MAFNFDEDDLRLLLDNGVTPGQLNKDELKVNPQDSPRYSNLTKDHEDGMVAFGMLMTQRLGDLRQRVNASGSEEDKMTVSGVLMTVQQTRLIYLLSELRRWCPVALEGFLSNTKTETTTYSAPPKTKEMREMLEEVFGGEDREDLRNHCDEIVRDMNEQERENPQLKIGSLVEDAWYAFHTMIFGEEEQHFMSQSSKTAAKVVFEEVYKADKGVNVDKPFSVLDVGCGAGFVGEELQKLIEANPGKRSVVVHGVDSSPSGLTLLQLRQLKDTPKVKLYPDDGVKLVSINEFAVRPDFTPDKVFPEKSYDCVVSSDTLMQAPVHGFPGPQGLTDCWKWVKPGGALVSSNSLAVTHPGFLGFHVDSISSSTRAKDMMNWVSKWYTRTNKEVEPFHHTVFSHVFWKKE